MVSYLRTRLLGMVLTVLIVLVFVFFIARLAPGDPAELLLGPDASAADAEALRERMGLNLPVPVQFLSFLGQLLRGDLGTSIFYRQPVLEVMAARAEPTILLTLMSLAIAVTIALPIGIYGAYRRGGAFDQGAVAVAMLAAALPNFWVGLLLQKYLGTDLGWFPVSGYGNPDASIWERVQHLVLPSIALGFAQSAIILRFSRASMLDVLGDDYIRTARSKGISERRVVLRHALRNALIPIVTVIGLSFALLISGAVITERVFNLPGVGSLIVGAVLRRDYPLIQAALIVVAALYILVNFLIDMIYLAIDPRVKY
ncbi:ABC transporter permease [Devosia sp. PTR5]|uniref:ABC transporter permease n=1 Tax=Devosia oryzisoli TaxID=2774138 RepID=A0A927ITM8_9HYPH|nr:ABC transporter permease [Devosia oryzisoli]MBD8065988.1 ABC transporter permease [Devosia oryzisoli]